MATLRAGEYYGERCLRKDSRASMSLVAEGQVVMYAVNKFDLVKLLPPALRAALLDGARFDELDEGALCDAFYRCGAGLLACP